MITWVYDDAPEEEKNAEGIASRIVATNFAAIHTSGSVRLMYAYRKKPKLTPFYSY
jgi:hypothetical protein